MKRVLLIALLSLGVQKIANAQGTNNLLIYCSISDDAGNPIDDAVMRIQHEDKRVDTLQGSHELQTMLDFDHKYILAFNAPGKAPKLIEVDTKNVPEKDRHRGFEWSLIVKLEVAAKPGMPRMEGKVYYDPEKQNFTSTGELE